MEVIADKVKFLDALHIEDTILQYGGRIVKKIILVILLVIVILAVGFISNILLFMAIAFVIVLLFLKSYSSSRSNRKRSLYTALDILGETVAQVVFIPPLAVSMQDGTLEEYESTFIKGEMCEWGYSEEYIADFIAKKASLHVDSLTLQIADFDKNLKEKFYAQDKSLRVSTSEINKKDLCRKSYDMCRQLYQMAGIVDPAKEQYLEEIKRRMKL